MYTSTHTPSRHRRRAFSPSPLGPQRETPVPAKIPRTWTDKQGHSKPQGHLLPFLPSRDTHKRLCREREVHTSETSAHTPLPPALFLHQTHTRDGTCTGTGWPPTPPNPSPPGWLCLPHVRSGEALESRIFHGRDTFPAPHGSAPRITTSSPSTVQAGAVDTVPPPTPPQASTACPSP